MEKKKCVQELMNRCCKGKIMRESNSHPGEFHHLLLIFIAQDYRTVDDDFFLAPERYHYAHIFGGF
jgi:hypothetical protein